MKRQICWFFVALWVCAGCGKKNVGDDACEDVACARGVCDPDTTDCVNAGSCGDDSECLEGFHCNDGSCFAEFPCEETEDCERGECASGACVNGATCSSEQQCLFGFRCVSGDCVSDRCADVECARGVCNPETGGCANSVVCTQGSQTKDCIDGYFCYGQSCELADDICDELSCERGVCEPSKADCIQPDDCLGSDTNCLEGYFCDDDDACVVNACDEDMVTCARGRCEPSTGTCENPRNCGRATDCIDGWSCAEGSCVEAGQECGPDGCPGNQMCVYVADDLLGVCDESPDGCVSTLDCVDRRVCRGGQCRAGNPCEPDAHEPNDVDDDARRIAEQPGNLAAGTLCAGDVDVFAFNTAESELFRGVFLVDVRIDSEDVGAGEVIVELVRPNGMITAVSSGATDTARIEHDVTALNQGEYLVRVKAGADLFASGVRYSLFANLLDESAVVACENAQLLDGVAITDNSNSGDSFILGSQCTSADNQAGENVFRFEITERSWVNIEITPNAGVDITAAVRRRCEVPDDLRCVNDTATSGKETITGPFEPGTYYVIVQGPTANAGGGYTMTFDAAPIVCGPANSECVDQTTARFCNPQGTGFEQASCEGDCDTDIGRCAREPRDVCYNAGVAGAGFSDSISWSTFTNDYDPGAGGCVPANGGTQTDGPDVAYKVDLPPNHVLIVDLDLAFSDYGSIYLTRNCDNLGAECIAAANQGQFNDEQLIYFSQAASTETLYVIADVEADAFSYGNASIAIDVRPTVCTPGATRCVGDDREVCDSLGTGWSGALCSFGCNAGACGALVNDTCTGPLVDLGNGMSFTGRIDEYSGNTSPSFNGCTSRSASGPDAMFSIKPGAGEVATITVDADFDVSLFAGTTCSDVVNTCVVGSDGVGINSEMIQFAGDGTTTYTVVVDSGFSGSGLFTIEATLQSPTCTPGAVLGCSNGSTLSYCSPLGVPVDYACNSSCSNGACDFPSGDICADPVVLTDPSSVSSPFDAANDIAPPSGAVGSCNFSSSPRGADRVYAVDLAPGDWLFADLASTTSSAMMYLLEDCNDTSTCVTNTNPSSTSSLVYEATATERVFVVVDRTTTGTSTLTYDLDIDVRRQDCTPGSTPFCTDSNTLTYCDNLGFTRDWDCRTTCTGNACDDPTGDVCVDPIVVQSGDSIVGNWSSGTNASEPKSPIDGHCPWDAGLEPRGFDDIYRIDLVGGDLLRVDLQTTNSSARMYVLENCYDTSTCRASDFGGGAGLLEYYARQAGPVWVVVDTTSSFASSTAYTVSFDVTAGASCAPNDVSCTAGAVSVCDGSGSLIEHVFTCPQGCANAIGCTPQAAADKCSTAPLLSSGTVVYGSFSDFTNDQSTISTGCTGGAGAGPDIFYAINATAGDVIHAKLYSWGTERVELSVVSDCTDLQNTCLAGSLSPDYKEVEVFYAPTTSGTYYIVGDSTSLTNDEPFSLEVEVIPTQCSPGTNMCSANGQSLRICNEYGLWDDYSCTGGCQNNRCGTPRGDVCFDAIPMQGGDSYSSSYDGQNYLAPSGDVGTCSFAAGETPVGVERYFSVDLLAGDVLEVDFTSTSSFGIVYILGACGDENACIDNTADGTSGFLRYRAANAETVYIVVDRTASGVSTLTWDLDVNVLTPDCTPGSASICSSSDTVQYCDALGFSIDYQCGGATPTCTAGKCNTPTGGACVDAVTANDGDSFSGTFQGSNDFELGAGTNGSCSLPGATSGIDWFYRVDLAANEVLLADFTSASSSGILYLVGDCFDGSTCIDNTASGTGGRLAYAASTPETVYLVIDRTTASTTSLGWTLDITIAAPNCTPGQQQCATNGTTLQWCNSFGLWEDYACSGTCSAGACDTPTGDACIDAVPLMHGSVVTDTYDGSNAIDLGSGTVGACNFNGSDQPGTDHFYRVDMAPGQMLNASYTTTSSYGILSLLGDCSDGTSCIANTTNGGSGAINYTATNSETVYLVMDRGLSGSTAVYDYTLTINLQ